MTSARGQRSIRSVSTVQMRFLSGPSCDCAYFTDLVWKSTRAALWPGDHSSFSAPKHAPHFSGSSRRHKNDPLSGPTGFGFRDGRLLHFLPEVLAAQSASASESAQLWNPAATRHQQCRTKVALPGAPGGGCTELHTDVIQSRWCEEVAQNDLRQNGGDTGWAAAVRFLCSRCFYDSVCAPKWNLLVVLSKRK